MGLRPTRVRENPLALSRRGTPWRAPTMAGERDFQQNRRRRRIPQYGKIGTAAIVRCHDEDSPPH